MAKKPSKKNSKIKENKKQKSKDILKLIIPIAVTAIVVVIAVALALALTGGKIAAKVNEAKITEKQLDQYYDFTFLVSGYPSEMKSLVSKETVLSQMIAEELLYQEAVKNGANANEEQVSSCVDDLVNSKNITEDKLSEAGLDASYLDYYCGRLQTTLNFANSTIFSGIEVSDEEAQQYYDNNSDKFKAGKDQIRVRHILVDTEEKAKEAYDLVMNGTDFAELAKEISICPSSSRGGDLGFVEKGQLVEEFENAAFALEVGKISEPSQTKFGWHVIKREPNTIFFSEAKELIKNALLEQRKQVRLEEYMSWLRKNAKIEILLGLEKNATPQVNTSEEVKEENQTQEEQITEPQTPAEEPEEEQNSTQETSGACYDGYNITANTVIFYHASWCPHCQTMMPIVEELESEGYKFLWVETSSGENTEAIDACFSDVIQGGVPEFICAGTKEYKLGSMSKENLKGFADKCKI
jgi:parvulin-like peptidyl-prolyl isomerase